MIGGGNGFHHASLHESHRHTRFKVNGCRRGRRRLAGNRRRDADDESTETRCRTRCSVPRASARPRRRARYLRRHRCALAIGARVLRGFVSSLLPLEERKR
jgi:hypothetical protein